MGVTFLSIFWILKRVRELVTRFFGSRNVSSSESENTTPSETSFYFKNLVLDQENLSRINGAGFYEFVGNPRPLSKPDNAALNIQKFYKSYQTRRNLADCAVVIEELWWKALHFDALGRTSVSSFCNEQPESAVSRWGRAGRMVAKVVKGLCEDKNAQKLAMCHWLEAKEREEFEVIIEDGKLMYKKSQRFLKTIEGSKWIFVLSTSRTLYVGKKIKGLFQHSSFLAGAATTSAGRMVVDDGVLKAVWPYSGHYLPTEENFKEFLCFLQEHQVDLSNVKKCPLDDDDPFLNATCDEKSQSSSTMEKPLIQIQASNEIVKGHYEKMEFQESRNVKSPRWTSGAGPRIGCVKEYPSKLQSQALEKVNLSQRKDTTAFSRNDPIPSPRPSSRVHGAPFAKTG